MSHSMSGSMTRTPPPSDAEPRGQHTNLDRRVDGLLDAILGRRLNDDRLRYDLAADRDLADGRPQHLAARRHADQRWRRTPARRDVLIALAGPTSGDSVGIRQRLRHPPPGDRHHRSRPGRYVLVQTVNPDRSLAERIYGNNRSRAASRIARVA